MSQLDAPNRHSTISKLYNNRRFIINTADTNTTNTVSTVQQIYHSKPVETYKSIQTKAQSVHSVDGVRTTVYKDYISIVHVYNNKGSVSTTTHNNTFTYVV